MHKGWSVSIALVAAMIVGAAAPVQAILPPASLSAQPMSSSAIALNWTSTDTTVTGFRIERSFNSSNGFTTIAQVAAGARTYTDGGLVASTTYYYRMRSLQGSKLSIRTAVMGATTMPPAPVATVTRTPLPTATPTATITATPVRTVTATRTATAIPTTTATATPVPTITATSIPTTTATATPLPTLTATPIPTKTATATPIPTVTATVTPIPTVTATARPTSTATATVVPTLTATPVPTATSTPDTTPPSVPAGVDARALDCGRVSVSWSASTDSGSGVEGYTVYRNAVAGPHVASPATTLTDSGLAGGTVYTYTVRAIDNAGNVSLPGAAVSVNTPACNQPPVASAAVTSVSGMLASLSGAGSSDPDGTIATYGWSFGDGASGSGVSVSHTYAAIGVYTATLTVTDNLGATATGQATVTVGTPGQAVWAQARGGSGTDVSNAIAVDGAGSSIVTGYYTGTTNFGTGTLANAGNADVFLAKYGSTGAPVWTTHFGGTGNDIGYAVAVDLSANCDGAGGTNCILVTGTFSGTMNLGTGPLTSVGTSDIFLAKYASGGTPLWAQRYGSSGDNAGYGVAVDASGTIFLTGSFTRSIDFGGGALSSPYLNQDVFVAKLSPAGGYGGWARNFTNASRDVGQALALTTNGDVIVAGWHLGSFDGYSSRGNEDIFVLRLAGATGTELWDRHFGSSGTDKALGVAVDSADDIAVTGTFQGSIDFGGGALAATGSDIFLLELTGGGAYRWAKHFGGTYDFVNTGLSVATDSNANVVIAGLFNGTADFGTGALTTAGGPYDAFVAKYDAAGSPLWAKRFGSTGTEYAAAVAIDPTQDDVLLTGPFTPVIDLGTGPLGSSGSYDIFLARLLP